VSGLRGRLGSVEVILVCLRVLSSAPAARCLVDQKLEHLGEMGAAAEIELHGHLTYAQGVVPEELLSPGDLLGQDVGMRGLARGGLELCGEMHAAETRHPRQLRQGWGLVEVGLDILQRPVEPPFRERRPSDCPSGRAAPLPTPSRRLARPKPMLSTKASPNAPPSGSTDAKTRASARMRRSLVKCGAKALTSEFGARPWAASKQSSISSRER
jgi:hypothetical protein